ncbi:hypothetical protein [Rhodoluna sp.]|jgi:uncharacterized protein (DUF983 family)|uniref:hypothetical protein n=1 Tax=Rhodoluna sp. TaxID=1969481 RepID=UPI0025CC61E7|nr:hypothetical protein [Rhodoluna sp.]
MAKPEKKKAEAKSLRSYLTLSTVAAVFVGVLVWGGVRDMNTTFIWAAITFIVSIVSIATLALMVKEDPRDPNEPRLK